MEVHRCNEKRDESGQEDKCIVDHPGFEVCCLSPWVLEVASVGLKTQTKRSYSTTRTEMNAAQSECYLLFSINRPCHKEADFHSENVFQKTFVLRLFS